MGTFRYESVFIGIPAYYHAVGPAHANPSSPGTCNTEGFDLLKLATSRDMKTWTRLGNRSVFLEPSRIDSGAYSTTQLLGPSDVIVRGEELWMYSGGSKYRTSPQCAPADFPHDTDGSGIELSTLRIDGFMSMDSIGNQPGMLTTSAFTSHGMQLFVNLRAMLPDSTVTVEVLQGGTGKRLAVSEIMSGDKPRMKVVWTNGVSPVAKGAVLQLRFTLTRASIYSWWMKAEVGLKSDDDDLKSNSPLPFVQLFKQGKDAFSCIRLPLLVKVPDGGPLIVFATAHHFSCYDGGGASLITRRSLDSGRTWSAVATLYNSTGGGPHNGHQFSCSGATYDRVSDSIILSCAASAGEVPPFTGPQGPYELWTWQSKDRNATSWQEKVNITAQLPYFVSLTRATAAASKDSGCEAGPGHGLVLPSGRLLQCAECAHRGTACFYSDDPTRQKWKEGGRVPAASITGCEVEAALLSNGSILLNMRTNGPFPHYPNVSAGQLHRLLSLSTDAGMTFSSPRYAEDLLDPLCQASTISTDHQLYTSGPRNQAHRADMTVSTSSDSGDSWQPMAQIWSGYSGYSSLVNLGSGELGLAFEGGPGGDDCSAISFVSVPTKHRDGAVIPYTRLRPDTIPIKTDDFLERGVPTRVVSAWHYPAAPGEDRHAAVDLLSKHKGHVGSDTNVNGGGTEAYPAGGYLPPGTAATGGARAMVLAYMDYRSELGFSGHPPCDCPGLHYPTMVWNASNFSSLLRYQQSNDDDDGSTARARGDAFFDSFLFVGTEWYKSVKFNWERPYVSDSSYKNQRHAVMTDWLGLLMVFSRHVQNLEAAAAETDTQPTFVITIPYP